MAPASDDPVWAVVAFDLPVRTAAMRRDANRYRAYLRHLGFSRIQLSVYAKYLINGAGFAWIARQVAVPIPPGGLVRMIPVPDGAWSRSVVMVGKKRLDTEPAPEQLVIF